MGRLTEDLARLRLNINDSREARSKDNAERAAQEYVRATSVNTTIAGFASARANQAKVDAQALEAFATENTRNVVNLLGRFSSDHQDRARQGRETAEEARLKAEGKNPDGTPNTRSTASSSPPGSRSAPPTPAAPASRSTESAARP